MSLTYSRPPCVVSLAHLHVPNSLKKWARAPLAGKPGHFLPLHFRQYPYFLGPLAQSTQPRGKSLTWMLSPGSHYL
jgi:hypothetical protein